MILRDKRDVRAAALAGLMLAMAAPLAASAASDKKSGFTYAILYPHPDPFTSGVVDAMRTEAEARGDKVTAEANAELSAQTQFTQALAVIEQKPDMILMSPVDQKASQAIVDAAAKAGIPVLNFLSPVAGRYEPPAYKGVDISILYDEVQSGRIGADIMASKVPPGSTIGVVLMAEKYPEAVKRYEGFKAGLASHGDYKIVEGSPGELASEHGYQSCQALMATNPEIKGLWLETDNHTAGCVRATNLNKAVIVSTGGSNGDKQMIQSGIIAGTACYEARSLGIQSIDQAHGFLVGEVKSGEFSLVKELKTTTDNVNDCKQTG